MSLSIENESDRGADASNTKPTDMPLDLAEMPFAAPIVNPAPDTMPSTNEPVIVPAVAETTATVSSARETAPGTPPDSIYLTSRSYRSWAEIHAEGAPYSPQFKPEPEERVSLPSTGLARSLQSRNHPP